MAKAFSIHLGIRFSNRTSTPNSMWACIWPQDDSKAHVDSVSVNVQKNLIHFFRWKVLSCYGNPVRVLSIESIHPLVFPFWSEGKRKTRGKTRWIGRFADKVPWIARDVFFFIFSHFCDWNAPSKNQTYHTNLRQDWCCCVKICNTQGPVKSLKKLGVFRTTFFSMFFPGSRGDVFVEQIMKSGKSRGSLLEHMRIEVMWFLHLGPWEITLEFTFWRLVIGDSITPFNKKPTHLPPKRPSKFVRKAEASDLQKALATLAETEVWKRSWEGDGRW